MRGYYGRALEGALSQLKVLLEDGSETERAGVAGGDLIPGAG